MGVGLAVLETPDPLGPDDLAAWMALAWPSKCLAIAARTSVSSSDRIAAESSNSLRQLGQWIAVPIVLRSLTGQRRPWVPARRL